jgi:hypothetical protein
MKQVFFYFTLFIILIIIGCKLNNVSGVYVCDQSQKKPASTINNGNTKEVFALPACSLLTVLDN